MKKDWSKINDIVWPHEITLETNKLKSFEMIPFPAHPQYVETEYPIFT